MPNFKLTIEYNGAKFFGSQIQKSSIGELGKTVQGELNKALCDFFKLDSIETIFGSRTDAGVHALGQVVNVFLPSIILEQVKTNPDKLLIGLNNFLDSDIVVNSIEQVENDFHSRFCAKSKLYMYKIFNRRHRPVLRLDSLVWVKEPLDFALMSEHAKAFLGERDFSAYSSDDEDSKNMICDISRSELIQESKYCFKYYIEGDRFLRHMVRRIVGELINVGRSKSSNAPYTAPAEGLSLLEIQY